MKRNLMMLATVCCMAVLAAAQSSDNSMKQDNMKGDKTVMGCVRSSNGMYMLEEGNGKMAMLTGQTDLSAHVGHTVALHGMWQKSDMANNNGMSGDKSSGMSGSNGMSDDMKKMKWDHKGESFMVNNVDMKSETCDMPMKNK